MCLHWKYNKNCMHCQAVSTKFQYHFLKFGAMHFTYYINRLIATKVDSTYLGY